MDGFMGRFMDDLMVSKTILRKKTREVVENILSDVQHTLGPLSYSIEHKKGASSLPGENVTINLTN
jgi:hypothetical protein